MAIVTPAGTTEDGRRRYELASPATRESIGGFETATDEEVRAMVARAREAQPAWAAVGAEGRAEYLKAALAHLVRHQDEFLEVIVRESGKPRMEALMIDVFAAADNLAYLARHAPRWLRTEKAPTHGVLRLTKKVELHHQPLGVVGVISPWNGPMILALNPAIQALVAGNTVVVKPSEVTPFSGKLAVDLFDAVGLPDGVMQVAMGDGATGAALVEAGVDKIHFTGSVATGRRIAESCGRQLIPCTLELGGNDAMIVCSDADLDTAAAGAVVGSMLNTGQYCCGTERVYVMEDVADEFTEKVVERVASLSQGISGEFDVGPMFWDRQLDKVVEQVDAAVAEGATVLAGGRVNPHLPGLFYEPTVLTDVNHEMAVMCEETFGPVLPIVRVSSVDEAVKLANDSEYGLAGSVWTRDLDKGARIAARIHTGSVSVNDMAMTYGIPEAPFGGRRSSGVGQANGKVGVRSFCHTQPIVIDRMGGRQTASQYPYTARAEKIMQRLVKGLWGKGAARVR
jgi:succinate-semialdehyde dehydrogenase/glutarate-semialdehyde dehydrogenase